MVLAVATVATAAMLALLPGDRTLRAIGAVTSGVYGLIAVRRANPQGTSGSVESLEVGTDGRAIMTERSGRRIASVIRPESYVGAWLASIVLRPDGARRSRVVAIWPDTMPVDAFRRLRVVLRHGQRVDREAMR